MLILICIPIFIEIEMFIERDSKIHLSDKKIYKYRIKSTTSVRARFLCELKLIQPPVAHNPLSKD